jgi:integrase
MRPGLRRVELCGLRWSDIDADGAGLTVRQTIVSVTAEAGDARTGRVPCVWRWNTSAGYSGSRSRAGVADGVPLAVPAQHALARHRAAQQNEREFLGVDYDGHGLVFCGPDCIPLRPDRVTGRVRAARGCVRPPSRPAARHPARRVLADVGRRRADRDRAMILGHSSLEITRRFTPIWCARRRLSRSRQPRSF